MGISSHDIVGVSNNVRGIVSSALRERQLLGHIQYREKIDFVAYPVFEKTFIGLKINPENFILRIEGVTIDGNTATFPNPNNGWYEISKAGSKKIFADEEKLGGLVKELLGSKYKDLFLDIEKFDTRIHFLRFYFSLNAFGDVDHGWLPTKY